MAEFPSTRAEAIAMAWLNQQDLSDKTPEYAEVLYRDAYQRIIAKRRTATRNADGAMVYPETPNR